MCSVTEHHYKFGMNWSYSYSSQFNFTDPQTFKEAEAEQFDIYNEPYHTQNVSTESLDQGQDDAGRYYNVAQVVSRVLAGRPPTSPKPKRATIAGKMAYCAHNYLEN